MMTNAVERIPEPALLSDLPIDSVSWICSRLGEMAAIAAHPEVTRTERRRDQLRERHHHLLGPAYAEWSMHCEIGRLKARLHLDPGNCDGSIHLSLGRGTNVTDFCAPAPSMPLDRIPEALPGLCREMARFMSTGARRAGHAETAERRLTDVARRIRESAIVTGTIGECDMVMIHAPLPWTNARMRSGGARVRSRIILLPSGLKILEDCAAGRLTLTADGMYRLEAVSTTIHGSSLSSVELLRIYAEEARDDAKCARPSEKTLCRSDRKVDHAQR